MSDPFPAPIYAETVLSHNFEDAKKYFLDALLEIHYAHTRMLAGCGLLTGEEEGKLLAALHGLDRNRIASAHFDGRYEDLFFFIEGLLEASGGTRTGRQDAHGSQPERHRRDALSYGGAARSPGNGACFGRTTDRAAQVRRRSRHDDHAGAHSHATRAADHSGALSIGRDRIPGARCRAAPGCLRPRESQSHGRGGDHHVGISHRPQRNRAPSRIRRACRKFLRSHRGDRLHHRDRGHVAVAMVNIGKLVQDLLLWSTREFGYLRLSDAFVQSSSIMPQKRNPVALEHVRILASRALGEAQAVLTCAHNTPFGDVNDSEDDLQPLVFTMFADARRALSLLAGALSTAQVNTELMADRARRDFLTVTELADTLVRREGLSFREAHALVADAVRACGARDDPASLAEALQRVPSGVTAYARGDRTVPGPRILCANPDRDRRSSPRTDYAALDRARTNRVTWTPGSHPRSFPQCGAGGRHAESLKGKTRARSWSSTFDQPSTGFARRPQQAPASNSSAGFRQVLDDPSVRVINHQSVGPVA